MWGWQILLIQSLVLHLYKATSAKIDIFSLKRKCIMWVIHLFLCSYNAGKQMQFKVCEGPWPCKKVMQIDTCKNTWCSLDRKAFYSSSNSESMSCVQSKPVIAMHYINSLEVFKKNNNLFYLWRTIANSRII